ncbi:MAG: hypothetical protein V1809_16695 [Planctomycetota bacterium]
MPMRSGAGGEASAWPTPFRFRSSKIHEHVMNVITALRAVAPALGLAGSAAPAAG